MAVRGLVTVEEPVKSTELPDPAVAHPQMTGGLAETAETAAEEKTGIPAGDAVGNATPSVLKVGDVSAASSSQSTGKQERLDAAFSRARGLELLTEAQQDALTDKIATGRLDISQCLKALEKAIRARAPSRSSGEVA